MDTYFITGSDNKYAEALAIIPGLQRLHLDLPEIQSVDPREVITNKLQVARTKQKGTLVVEDTSLYLDCLAGQLPGPLIKWFLKSLGGKGIYEIAERFGEFGARAVVMVGYSNGENIRFFEGVVRGTLVPHTGDSGFGWDPIFRPEGHERTFGQMSFEEKSRDSHRKRAFEKLKKYLDSQKGTQ